MRSWGLVLAGFAGAIYGVAAFHDVEAYVRVWALVGLGIVTIAGLLAVEGEKK